LNSQIQYVFNDEKYFSIIVLFELKDGKW